MQCGRLQAFQNQPIFMKIVGYAEKASNKAPETYMGGQFDFTAIGGPD